MIPNSSLQAELKQFFNSLIRAETITTTKQMTVPDILILVSFTTVLGLGFVLLLWAAGAITITHGVIVVIVVVGFIFGYLVIVGYVEIKHTRRVYEKLNQEVEVTANELEPIQPIQINVYAGEELETSLEFEGVTPQIFIAVLQSLITDKRLSEQRLCKELELLNKNQFTTLAFGLCQATVHNQPLATAKPTTNNRTIFTITEAGVNVLGVILAETQKGDFKRANALISATSNLNSKLLEKPTPPLPY